MAVALVVGAGQIESGRLAQSQAQTAPITIAPQNLTSNNLGTFVSSDYTPLANVARDERLYAVGYCATPESPPQATRTLPAQLKCDALARWRAGFRDVVFPAGTWWMPRGHSAVAVTT